jgi:hypothetical protein
MGRYRPWGLWALVLRWVWRLVGLGFLAGTAVGFRAGRKGRPPGKRLRRAIRAYLRGEPEEPSGSQRDSAPPPAEA